MIADNSGVAHFKGVALIVLATFLFSSHDGVSKHLAQLYPIVMVVWARYAVHSSLMTLIFIPRHGVSVLKSKCPRLQLLRGMALVSTSLFFTSSLYYLPLAEATSIHFLAPLLVVVLSATLIGEAATAKQYLSALLGLAGTLFIVRPGGDFLSPAALLPFGSATCFALYQLLTRKISAYDSATTSNFLGGLIATVVMTLLLPFYWKMPSMNDGLLMLALGTLGMVSHLIFTKSSEYAPPASLAPFGYCQILFSTLIGVAIFHQAPEAMSMIGMAIIAVSGAIAIKPRSRLALDKHISVK